MNKEIKAQEWLDKKYPIDDYSNDSRYRHPDPEDPFEFKSNYWKNRSEIVSLNISTFLKLTGGSSDDPESVKLSGDLNLTTFSNLKYLDISGNQITDLKVPSSLEVLYCSSNFLSSLILNHCSNLKILGCVKNNITNLNLKDNLQLSWLYCYHNQLKCLDLTLNKNLQYLDCSFNQLEDIIFNNEQKLRKIKLSNNLLTYFPYENVNNESLVEFSLSNNNLEITNIDVFKKFINLEKLWIGNTNAEKVKNNIYNWFYGSFESLKDLNLTLLTVDNTDINHGSKYLPITIEFISFFTWLRPNCGLVNIEYLNRYYSIKNFNWNYNDCFNFQIEEEFLTSEKVTKEKTRKQFFLEKSKLITAERNLWKETFNLSEEDLNNNLENWKNINLYKIFTGESFNEIKKWLDLGFYFEEFFLVKLWKKNVSFETTKFLLSKNLLKKDQLRVVLYWSELYNREVDEFNLYELEMIKKRGFVANYWMDVFYSKKDIRSEFERMEINNQFLSGELDLSDFINLKWIDCSNNNLTKLIINPKIKSKLNHFNYSGNNPNLEISFLDNQDDYDNESINSVSSLWKSLTKKIEQLDLIHSYYKSDEQRHLLSIEE
ncbi:MAG: hypothetical protein AM1032_000378 [Mycoplasmataceae bacterium]|nr:MAG: hypothetical protein AM1032_000378 [Mycoplasmataceae bacterium]